MGKGHKDDLINTINELKHPSGTNWLRHRAGSQAAAIDEMFLKGMTEDEMVREINRKGLNLNNKGYDSILSRVIKSHYKHLTLPLAENAPITKNKSHDIGHGLPITQDSDRRWKFDLQLMEQMIDKSANDQRAVPPVLYLPTKADIEIAESQVRKSSKEVVSIKAVLDQVEINSTNAGKVLKDNWRYITQRNIELWFKK